MTSIQCGPRRGAPGPRSAGGMQQQGPHQAAAQLSTMPRLAALTGNPGIGSYIASKHGVIGLTRTAALEYVKKDIRVNAVNPA